MWDGGCRLYLFVFHNTEKIVVDRPRSIETSSGKVILRYDLQQQNENCVSVVPNFINDQCSSTVYLEINVPFNGKPGPVRRVDPSVLDTHQSQTQRSQLLTTTPIVFPTT